MSFGYAVPKIDLPTNLTELILIGGGALVRIQQRAERDWIAVIQQTGQLDRQVRADTRAELLLTLNVKEELSTNAPRGPFPARGILPSDPSQLRQF